MILNSPHQSSPENRVILNSPHLQNCFRLNRHSHQSRVRQISPENRVILSSPPPRQLRQKQIRRLLFAHGVHSHPSQPVSQSPPENRAFLSSPRFPKVHPRTGRSLVVPNRENCFSTPKDYSHAVRRQKSYYLDVKS